MIAPTDSAGFVAAMEDVLEVHAARPARRIPDRATLARELRAWQRARNHAATHIRWQSTTFIHFALVIEALR